MPLQRSARDTRWVGAELNACLHPDEVAFDVPLAGIGRWGIGGPADMVVTPRTSDSLRATMRILGASAVPHVTMGDATNVLFDDRGFRGVIVRIGQHFAHFDVAADGTVTAGAGVWVPCFVRQLVARGLGGAIHAIGIPGTLGGLIVMNGGSQRRGIGDCVIDVDAVGHDGTLHRIAHDALDFGYRSSSLQNAGMTVVSARFQFDPAGAHALRREAIALLAARRAKFPLVRANCGSVFVSDPALYQSLGPPGRAIEHVGLKGHAIGNAQISPDHANFIVNNGGASSADVLALIRLARRRVADATGIAMATEVRYLDPMNGYVSAGLAAENAA